MMSVSDRLVVFALMIVLSSACGSVSSAPDGGTGKGGSNATGSAGSTGSAGTTGAAGTTGSAGTMGNAGSGASGRGGTTGTAGGGGAGSGGSDGTNRCAAVTCSTARMCCDGACVNLQNDPFNCGGCGKVCQGDLSFCGGGTCQRPECSATIDCATNTTCCGNSCCTTGQLCCAVEGPVGGLAPTCYTPTKDQPSCPQGCAPLCVSDRNRKKNIAPVDTSEILKKVSALPISTWSYTSEPSDVRHLGPMAQDFRASFGLGSDDRTYHSVDAHGVALAAIQALEHVVAEQEKRIQRLERENQLLERQLRPTARESSAKAKR
jgi:hypothetical protein